MRVIDFKDGIKGEGIRLLLMKANVFALEKHLDFDPYPHIIISPTLTSDTGAFVAFQYLPELHEGDRVLHGLSECLVSLGTQFNFLPRDPELLYEALKLIREIDNIQSLISLLLYTQTAATKERTQKQIVDAVAGLVTALNSLRHDRPGSYLLEDHRTILDFAVFGLYTSCPNELVPLICGPMEGSVWLRDWIGEQGRDFLPLFVKNGKYMTCFAEGPYADIYKLMMSRVLLPSHIVPSTPAYFQVFNKKYFNIPAALQTFASLFGIVKDTGRAPKKSDICALALEELLSQDGNIEESARRLHEIEQYYTTHQNRQLRFNDKGCLEDIYCAALAYRLIHSEDATWESRYPNFYAYTEDWFRHYTLKEHAVLITGDYGRPTTHTHMETFLSARTEIPFDQADYLMSMGYKTVIVDFILLKRFQEQLERYMRSPEGIKDNIDLYNFCDGAEDLDDFPGQSVARFFQQQNWRYIGVSSECFDLTTYKHLLKARFTMDGVPTSPYVVMSEWDAGKAAKIQPEWYPMIVKLSTDRASSNMSLSSKCHNVQDLEKAVKLRVAKLPGEIFVIESFIHGPEYTVLTFGNYDGEVVALWPLEFIFKPHLKAEDAWIHAPGLYNRRMVDDVALAQELMRIAKVAYISSRIKGYGRIDFRRSKATGQLYVLESNALAGVGYNRVTDTILQHEHFTVKEFMQAIAYYSHV